MYSIIKDGQVLDYKYKKLGEVGYAFYVGDNLLGTMYHIGRGWAAVGVKPDKLYPLEGFRSRYDASEFLIKMSGIRS